MKFSKKFVERNALLLLLAVLITSIGNGIHGIALGKLLYDKTGSYSYFAFVLILQNFSAIALNPIAGFVVDGFRPKYIAFLADTIRGIVIIIAALIYKSSFGLFSLGVAIVVLQVAKPFFKSSSFSLISSVVKPEDLSKYYSLGGTLMEVGVLMGVALGGPLISLVGIQYAFAIDGITYLISGFCFISVMGEIFLIKKREKHIPILNHFYEDWKEILTIVKKDKPFSLNLLFSSGDFIVILMVNMIVLPYVNSVYGGDVHKLSWFFSAFSAGAISAPLFIGRLRINWSTGAWLQAFQAFLLFAILPISNYFLGIVVFVALGLVNSLSLCVFMSSLQKRCDGPIRGRISSLRNMIVALISMGISPLLGFLFDYNFFTGAAICGSIALSFALLTIGYGMVLKKTDEHLII